MMRSIGLVAAMFICGIGVAGAQLAPPKPVSPEMLQKLLPKIATQRGMVAAKGSTPVSRAAAVSGGGASLQSPGNVPTGWNIFHATNCEWVTDGTNDFLFVLPQEGGFWFIVNNLFVTQTFLTGCVQGNFEAVFVVDPNSGAFTNVLTWPFS
jgi:hypothetical protein